MYVQRELDGDDSVTIANAMKAAINHYDEKTYLHAMRVAGYVASNLAIPHELREDCICLAFMHDLLEDTDYDPTMLPYNFHQALDLLTKPKDMPYVSYCRRLRCNKNAHPIYTAAWFVKLADIKDHLCLKETLTDKLKAKYLEGLAELL